MNNKLVMIHISNQTSGRMVARLANYFNQENFKIVITGDNEADLNGISLLLNKNIVTHHVECNPYSKTEDLNEISYPVLKKISHIGMSKEDLNLITIHYKILKKKLNIARDIIKYYQPKMLIVSEDGISGNCFIIKAAHEKKIPVLVVPYGYGTSRDLENSLEIKSRTNDLVMCDGELGKVVKKYYSQWVKKGRFEGAVMFIPAYIIAREELGLTISNPWIIHGGLANKIAVESKQMYEHYQRENIPEEKLALTGTVYCDLVHEEINKSIYYAAYEEGRKIDSGGRTSLLISWPTSYHAERAHLCEFESYEALTTQFFSYLTQLKNVSVTVSLHPAVLPEHKELIARYVDNFSDEYIINLIPKHDIYISCFSSTVRWAIAAGKPVINYDFYTFNLPDYDSAPGVIRMSAFNEFQQVMRQLIEEETFYKKMTQLQKSVASQWGMLDGNNFARIRGLVAELAFI